MPMTHGHCHWWLPSATLLRFGVILLGGVAGTLPAYCEVRGRLAVRELGHHAAATPDGNGVLFSHRLPGERWTFEVQEMGRRGVTTLPVEGEIEHPVWSPDSEWLLYYRAHGEVYALEAWHLPSRRRIVLDAAAARPHRIVPAVWLPDSSGVLYLRCLEPRKVTDSREGAKAESSASSERPAWLRPPDDASVRLALETGGVGQARLTRYPTGLSAPVSHGVPAAVQRILALPTLAYQLRRVYLTAPDAGVVVYATDAPSDNPLLALAPGGGFLVTHGSVDPSTGERRLAILDPAGRTGIRHEVIPLSGRVEAASLAWDLTSRGFAAVVRSFDLRTRRSKRGLVHWTPDGGGIRWLTSIDEEDRNAPKRVPRVLRVIRPDWGRQDLDPIRPVFARDGLVWVREGNVWRLPLDSGLAECLTVASPLIFDALVRQPGVDDEHVEVSFVEPGTWRSGTARVSLRDGAVNVDRRGEAMENVAVRGYGTMPALFYRTTASEPWDIFASGSEQAPLRRVTEINSGLRDRDLGRAVRLSWKGLLGEDSGGVLLVPSTIPPGGAPVVLCAYPDDDPRMTAHTFDQQGGDSVFNRILVDAGYAVLLPRLPVTPPGDRQMSELFLGAETALEAAEKTGLVDGKRAGIYGYSWGGYMVHAVIAQSRKFRAAVAGAGYSDLMSDFVGAGEQSMVLKEGRNNSGVGGTPWEKPEVYRANSPLWLADSIETPLLLVHAAGDVRVVPEGSEQVFRALRRLERPVAYLRYEEGGHAIFEWSAAQQADLWQRLLAWFDEYLGTEGSTGSPGPQQQGRPPEVLPHN